MVLRGVVGKAVAGITMQGPALPDGVVIGWLGLYPSRWLGLCLNVVRFFDAGVVSSPPLMTPKCSVACMQRRVAMEQTKRRSVVTCMMPMSPIRVCGGRAARPAAPVQQSEETAFKW